jgi:NAD(P)H-dependent FMN reductase
MSTSPRILVFAGSARKDSFNKKLAAVAAGFVNDAGGQATLVDLRDYEMPLYDGDLEEGHGVPEAAARLRAVIKEHDGLLVSCPEYNSSITPLLKNTIDWVSREDGDEPGLIAFKGKVAGLLSASPGPLGGLRGLVHVRSILQNIGVLVVPKQMAVGSAFKAFNEDGSLADEKTAGAVRGVVEVLVKVSSDVSD